VSDHDGFRQASMESLNELVHRMTYSGPPSHQGASDEILNERPQTRRLRDMSRKGPTVGLGGGDPTQMYIS
jgi:hypothetical protein